MNLKDLDPAIVMPPELDALIATEWMGWRLGPNIGGRYRCWLDTDDVAVYRVLEWSPFTNPDHAGVARRRAESSGIWNDGPLNRCVVWVGSHDFTGVCDFAETNGNEGEAEALATMRAIIAAMQNSDKVAIKFKEGN